MNQIEHISIPKPCQTTRWENMVNTEGGRHCANCNTTVVDFMVMDTDQIVQALATRDKICGNFTNQQLALINSSAEVQKNSTSFWQRLAVAAAVLLCAVPFYKTDARSKQKVMHVFKKNKAGQIFATDFIKTITITGKITDTTNDGLEGSIIQTLDKKYKTQADTAGNFKLTMPDTVKKFSVSSVGFWTVEINVNSKPEHQYKVVMTVQPHVMGEIIIKRN